MAYDTFNKAYQNIFGNADLNKWYDSDAQMINRAYNEVMDYKLNKVLSDLNNPYLSNEERLRLQNTRDAYTLAENSAYTNVPTMTQLMERNSGQNNLFGTSNNLVDRVMAETPVVAPKITPVETKPIVYNKPVLKQAQNSYKQKVVQQTPQQTTQKPVQTVAQQPVNTIVQQKTPYYIPRQPQGEIRQQTYNKLKTSQQQYIDRRNPSISQDTRRYVGKNVKFW